jgi:hypothetical protein
MTEALTGQEFSLYGLLYLKFESRQFGLDSVRWYFSRQTLKKLVFNLVKSGWLKRAGRGVYACISPKEAVSGLFEPMVGKALQESNLGYCFTKASAAEVWSNETYIQRSWEYSPFFVKVLKKDLPKWKQFLGSKEIKFFTDAPSNTVGEFVVLVPVASMKIDFHNSKPVEPVQETIGFCEANKDSFEYVLAYLSDKYNKKTTASKAKSGVSSPLLAVDK